MKMILLTTALVFAGAAAMAADFDNNSVDLVLERDNLTFGISTLGGEATDLSVGVTVLPYAVMGADADLTFAAEYGIQSKDFTLSATYGLSKNIDKLNVYGDLEAAYTIASGANEGSWAATPTVGTAYRVNDKLAAYGEVSYSWNVSNDWTRDGGAVEVGARYAINDDLALTPSLVRTFDTGADETNLNLKLALRF
jgi:opacity protein-like surface antigen